MSILEARGYFWWHEDEPEEENYRPETSVAGSLTIDDDGYVKLELDGFLVTGSHPIEDLLDLQNPKKHNRTISGILKEPSRHVLLIGSQKQGGGTARYGITHERYRAEYCLVGDKRIPWQVGEHQFTKLEIDLKGFEEWLRLGSIEVEGTPDSVNLEYKKPEDVHYCISGGNITLKYEFYGRPYIKTKVRDYNIREAASLIYQPDAAMNFDALLGMYKNMQETMTLLTNSEYSIDWPTVAHSAMPEMEFHLYFRNYRSKAKSPDAHECCVSFVRVRDSFGDILSNWSEKRKRYGSGFYLYMGTRSSMKLYIEHHFMNLMWGLETFHRIKFGDETAPLPKMLEKIARILNDVKKSSDKNWLRTITKISTEPKLSDRMYNLFKDLPISLKQKELRIFCDLCARSRNEISHYGGPKSGTPYHEFMQDVHNKIEALTCLYHILLLNEVDISAEIISHWVYKGLRSSWIREALQRFDLIETTGI